MRRWKTRTDGCCFGLILSFGLCSGVAAQRVEDALRIDRSAITGSATFLRPKDGRVIPLNAAAGGQIRPADFFSAYGRLFGIEDAARQLVAGRVHKDALGHAHSAFQQVHVGVPVFSGTLKIHQNAAGEVYAANGRFYSIPANMAVAPQISAEAAAKIAIGTLEAIRPRLASQELVIVDPGWYGDLPMGPRLAWQIFVYDDAAGAEEAFFVDALGGKILDRWPLRHTSRNRQIHDAGFSGDIPGRLIRPEGSFPMVGSIEVDLAYDYYGDTYDYLQRAFGRDSLDDLGMPLIATVNSRAVPCPNAFWSERIRQAVFCPGMVTDDIAAHELVHGLTSRTAALIYQNQPGQLNESFSDVFGELVDLFNGDGAFLDAADDPLWPAHPSGPGVDTPNLRRQSCSMSPDHPDGVRWLLGEDAPGLTRAMRDMWMPTCLGMPDRANHPYMVCQVMDSGGVHFGSSVPNHAFALATDGAEFNGYAIDGIGPIKSGAIWYRALTEYMTAAGNFEDAFHAIDQSARDLVGTYPNDPRTGFASSDPMTDYDAQQVRNALLATEMNTAGACGHWPGILDSGPAPQCGTKTVRYQEDFEGPATGWFVANTSTMTRYDWTLTDHLPAERPGRAFYCPNPPIGNCFDQNESGVHTLTGPEITLPAELEKPTLSFAHYIAVESGFDGGNLQIRVNGGEWRAIRGGDFRFNPYNTVFRTAAQNSTNPMGGEEGWTGAGGYWGVSLIDLGRFVRGGETIQLRFRFGKDLCNGVEGWYIDDVEIYTCPDCNRNGYDDRSDTRFTAMSDALTVAPTGTPTRFSFQVPDEAQSDVRVTVSAIADLGSIREELQLSINGVPMHTMFDGELGRDCPFEADIESVEIPAALFNAALAGSKDCVIELLPSDEVDTHLCPGTGHLRILVDFHPLGRDEDQDGVPDECQNCMTSVPPAPQAAAVPKNRYLSIAPGNFERWTALRVNFKSLPGGEIPPDNYWVDRPWTAQVHDDGSVHALARLTCEPVFLDWSQFDVVHIGDVAIIPGATYEVQAIDLACVPPALPLALVGDKVWSTPLTIATSAVWGDVTGHAIGVPLNGRVDTIDLVSTIDVLANRSSMDTIRADLFPAEPDGMVDIRDIATVVDALVGWSYPYGLGHRCR